jgi:hypothetical protein
MTNFFLKANLGFEGFRNEKWGFKLIFNIFTNRSNSLKIRIFALYLDKIYINHD